MINERIALVMLEGEIPSCVAPDPHYTKRMYQSIQTFANASLNLCEVGKVKKFEEFLNVALRLFREGNETVKDAIVNIYLFTVSHALEKHDQALSIVKKVFPKELMTAYHRFHSAGGL